MQTICMPADRPTTMLFSPIRGTMCNTRMHIVYVWKETKIPQVQARKKKKKQTQQTKPAQNKQTPPKSDTDSVRCQLFLEGTVFLRFLLLSADAGAEAKAAPCVPGSGVQGLLTQEFPFPSALCSAHRRLLHLPTECEVILVLCLCCEGTPSRGCQSYQPVLSYAWGRRAGGAVLWQLLCARDLSWQSYSSPSVFIYILLSSNCTRH